MDLTAPIQSTKYLPQKFLYFPKKTVFRVRLKEPPTRFFILFVLMFLYLSEKPISYNFLYLRDKVNALDFKFPFNINKYQSVSAYSKFLFFCIS